jgi:endo-1,4-beta-xylanase
MKNGPMHPTENEYNFKDADAFVKFGVDNGLTITGHCLIWHSQLAPWFCYDADHNLVPADTLKKRMKEHITTVVSRYKDQIIGWDVVNEAIEDDGSWRNSPLYQILGEEFIALAFQYAHEADPDAELYYNDYNMFMEGKRNTVVKMINDFKARGIKIDAVGMQAHIGMDYPEMSEFEKSIQAFSEAGVKVMITELDLSALPTFKRTANVGDAMSFREMMEKGLPEHLNPYKDGIPDSASVAWNSRMMDFFNLFDKYSDAITRVTAWGVNDAQSWKNGFPIPGRTDYPLLFDRQYQPKPFVKELIENYKKNKK